jgi:hypothetical protein
MTEDMAPPEMPPKPEPTTMPEMLQTIRDEADMLERALAGYTHLTDILRQQTQGMQPGERAKGLPILGYRATADGVHAVDVRADLAKIDPAFVPHVLSPMCNVHASEMLDSLTRIHKCATAMLGQVQMAMGGGQPEHPPQQPEPAQVNPTPATMEQAPAEEYGEEAIIEGPSHQSPPAPSPGVIPPVS